MGEFKFRTKFCNIALWKKPEDLLPIEKDWQQLSTFSIDPRSKGFSELIDQLSEICNVLDTEMDLVDEEMEEIDETAFWKEVKKNIQEIYQAIQNYLIN